jgi:prolipoprotein diacylglyceryltransferase
MKIFRTFKQLHSALERIRMIVIHLALSGARLSTFRNTKFAFRVRNKGVLNIVIKWYGCISFHGGLVDTIP